MKTLSLTSLAVALSLALGVPAIAQAATTQAAPAATTTAAPVVKKEVKVASAVKAKTMTSSKSCKAGKDGKKHCVVMKKHKKVAPKAAAKKA